MDSRPVLAVLLAISWAVTCEGQLQCSKSCPSEDSYMAAVVEYHPEGNPRTDEARTVLELNLANYETFVVKAAMKGADIVVFPEYGLIHTWLSDHRKEIMKYAQVVPAVHSGNDGDADVPCLQGNVSWVIKRISCSARKNKIYVAVNIPEAVHCDAQDEDCPSDGFFIYNANIAFDRNGAVVSKYHKYNLFLEPAINKPKKASLSTFSTDFNVTFGVFICFDILFKEPAFDLVNTEKITDIIYSTAWGSQLPFLAAVQFQASWSYGLGVNFLGSEYNDPERGYGGSGIYSGVKGPLLTYVPSKTGSQLLVACIPKINGKISPGLDAESSCQREAMILPTSALESVDIPLRLLHEDISKYSSSSAFKDGEIETTVCSGEFCCQFYADIQLGDASNNSTYRFLAFDGVRKFGSVMYKGAIQVCSILYCLGDDFHTCGYIPEDNSDFKPVIRSLRISGNFDSSQMVLPNSVNFHLKPIPTESYNFIKNTEGFQFSSKDHMESILSISIYGRNFNGDGN